MKGSLYVLLAALLLVALGAAPSFAALQSAAPSHYATDYLTLNYLVDRRNGYTVVQLVPDHGRVVPVYAPGGPALQAVQLVYRLPPGVNARVEVEPLASVKIAIGTVEPSPPLYAYLAGRLVEIRGPDPRVYNESVTPGALYAYHIEHRGDATILYVYVNPVQYRGGTAVVYTRLRIDIYTYPDPLPSPQPGEKPVLLVIAPTLELARFVAALAKHAHPDAVVLAAGLDANVSSAQPLMLQLQIPGFLAPTVPPLPYLQLYDYETAARIRGFIAYAREKYGVNHVLLVGGASEIPPSYYYSSQLEYFYAGPYNAWIPTDYFYSDLDLDGEPEVYVGRLPFTDKAMLSDYYEKLILYEDNANEPTVGLIAGYPFAQFPPIGEAALTTLTLEYNALQGLEATVVMTRTLGNYTRDAFRRLILYAEQPVWTFIIAHGAGNLWADRVYNKTMGMVTWELLLNSSDIIHKSTERPVGIISSVACINGAWDTDLVLPPFQPPSIGEAIVESWGGVAYIGHSRVAFEWLTGRSVLNATKGVVTVSVGGAILLHTFILREWSNGAATLGEAVWEGAASYARYWKANVIYDNIRPVPVTLGQAMVYELTLLGDPLTPLPSPKPTTAEPELVLKGYQSLVSVSKVLMALDGAARGELPVYRPCYAEEMGIDAKLVRSVGVARAVALPSLDLVEYEHVESVSPEVALRLGGSLTGFIALGASSPKGYVLAVAPAMGLCGVSNGTHIHVKLWAADILTGGELNPVMIYSDGDLLNIVLERNAEFTVEYRRPGVHRLLALPREAPSYGVFYMPQLSIYELIKEFYSDNITIRVLEPLEVNVGAVSLQAGRAEIPVQVKMNGMPVDAVLHVEVVGGNISTKVIRVAPGSYLVVLEGAEPGVYQLRIEAIYNGTYVEGFGSTAAAVHVDELVSTAASRITSRLVETASRLESELKGEIGYLSKTLGERLSAIQSSLADTRSAIISAISEAEERITSSVDNAVKRLGENLSSRIQQSIRGLEERLADTVKTSVSELGEKIEKRIDERLSAAESSINEKIDSVASTLSEKMDGLEERLGSVSTTTQATLALVAVTLASSVGLYFRRLA